LTISLTFGRQYCRKRCGDDLFIVLYVPQGRQLINTRELTTNGILCRDRIESGSERLFTIVPLLIDILIVLRPNLYYDRADCSNHTYTRSCQRD
jgi:hypothetical protein